MDLRNALQQYTNADRTFQDISACLIEYKGLRSRFDNFNSANSSNKLNVCCLFGTIPVKIKDQEYNIPLTIAVPLHYPEISPIIDVKPTDQMLISPGTNVDANGRVIHSYLSNWQTSNTIASFLSILRTIFSQNPPVYAKPKAVTVSVSNDSISRAPMLPPKVQNVQSSQESPLISHPLHSSFTQNVNIPYHNPPPPLPKITQTINPANFQGQYRPNMNLPFTPPVLNQPFTPPPIPMKRPNPPSQYEKDNQKSNQLKQSLKSRLLNLEQIYLGKLKREFENQLIINKQLNESENQINENIQTLTQNIMKLEQNIQHLYGKSNQIQHAITIIESEPSFKLTDIKPTRKQDQVSFDCVSEIQAIDDVIYQASHALSKESIELQYYLKIVRNLGREQFFKKDSLIKSLLK